MFYYRIGQVLVVFDLINEKNKQWKLTAYKVGVKGGWTTLFTKTKSYVGGYTTLKHFSEAHKRFKNKTNSTK